MDYEHKSNLETAIFSQTWNKSLAGAVVNAIEADLKKPKPKKSESMLQLAVEKEKEKRLKSGRDISESCDE